MKSLKCADIDDNGCEFEAHGETNQQVVDKMFEHALRDHRQMFESMTDEHKANMIAKMNNKLDEQD